MKFLEASSWSRLPLYLAGCLTLYALILHAVPLFGPAPLWRDEVNSINLVSLPLHSMVPALQFDSFPGLWLALLRAWMFIVGNSDFSVRLLGALTGTSLLACLWFTRPPRHPAAPLLAIGLIGLNPDVILYGDSNRAYGLGLIFTLLVWFVYRRAVELRARRAALIAAGVISFLAVHTLYYCALVVFACAVGAALAVAATPERRHAYRILLAPAPAAVSLLVYLPVWRAAGRWFAIIQTNADGAWLVSGLYRALRVAGRAFPRVYLILAGAILLYSVLMALQRRVPPERRPCFLFYLWSLVIGTAIHFLFLRATRFIVQPWYYLTLIVIVGLALQDLTGLFPRRAARLFSIVGASALFLTVLGPLPSRMLERRTNLDVVAASVASHGNAQDLVIVSPWMLGITFERYYSGDTPWVTVPPLEDHTMHRYDQLQEAMRNPAVMAPLIRRCADVLRHGGRVFWIASDLALPAPGEDTPILPAAPNGAWRWAELPHYRAWNRQVGRVFVGPNVKIRDLQLTIWRAVSSYENPRVWIIQLH